jgi:hypothetical protein
MKSQKETRGTRRSTVSRNLTLGELIFATYSARGARAARKILGVALESNLVRFAARPSL